jgi:hypothetical protein
MPFVDEALETLSLELNLARSQGVKVLRPLASTKNAPRNIWRHAFSVTLVFLEPLANSLVGMEGPTTPSNESN